MLVDGENVGPSLEYTFKTKGEHELYILLNDANILSLSNMFKNNTNLRAISFTSKFNSQNVVNMEEMFNSCSALISIDFSYFNSEKINNMAMLFNSCSSLQSINFANFNTKKVTNMTQLFKGCSNLKYIDLSKFDTENVIDMGYMFYSCGNLKK